MNKIVLATDLGGTNLRMAAVNIKGEVLHREKISTPRSETPDELIDSFVEVAKKIKSELVDYEVIAIAAAVPGTINFEKGIILKAPNLPELDGLEIIDALEERLNIKAILENDANAAAIGENWHGASKGYDNSIMVMLGTGVGGGIIINGQIIRGIDGTGGEIGHINVEPDGHPCGCGSFGCVEQYSSATAIVRMANEFVTENSFSKMAEVENFSSEDVFNIAVTGNGLAKEVFRKQGYYLGIMLAGLINSLNPEAIIIGGGASQGWDLFIPYLEEQIKIRTYKEPGKRAKILKAQLGDDAGILGVAKLGFHKALNQTG